MADTAVQITAGSGTSIDTRTEATNGNHRQVVTLGDPSVNAGVAPVDATAGLKVDLGADNDVTVTSGTVSISGTVTVASHAVTNAGTFATQIDGAALTALQLIDNVVLAEDAVHGSGDPGIQVLAVRKDATGTLAGADGDYAPLQVDSTGALRVVGGTASTQYNEDAAHASGDAGTMALVVRKDAAASIAGSDGDYTALQVDANGALRVSGGVSSTQYAEDAAHVSGDTGTMALGVRRDADTSLVGTDGDYAPFQLTALGALKIAITEDAIGSTLDTEDGSIAIGQADVALVAELGYRYNSAAGAWVRAAEPSISESTSNTDGVSTAFTNFGATASVKNVVTAYTVFRTDAGTSMARIDFRDGTGGAVLWSAPLPPGGGSISPPDMEFKTTANTALAYDVSSALSTVYISVSGFKRA
jgi:hypothetical protein